jgi:hypothetical protein
MMQICGATQVNEYGNTMVELMRDNRDPQYPWLGALVGSAIIGFWYWCTDQFIVQRVLSGKNQTEARRGTIFGAYLKLLPVFLFLIPGMIAYALHTKGIVINGEVFRLSTPDAAFPTLVARLLPAGVKGLVVCGILAALMIFNNAIQANISYYYMDRCYERSYATAVEMIHRVRPLAEESGAKQIAVAGKILDDVRLINNEEQRYLPLLSVVLDSSLLYDHIHIQLMMQETFGLEIPFMENEEAFLLSQSDEVAQMGVWPAMDSVQVVGDTIVIKIDDFEEGEWSPVLTIEK